jgi:hypothetical protein
LEQAMSTDKSPSDKPMSDLSQKPLSDAAAQEVKGGAAPITGPTPTPIPIPRKPIVPRTIDPCW